METGTKNMREQLHRLAKSYTPEWKFTQETPDAGSVLGMLISDMLEDSSNRLERAMHKHKIQYLSRFDALIKEPVSVSKGYVQFTPVTGSEGLMLVPKGTEISADTTDEEILFETMHDVCLADTGVTSVIVTDGKKDKIVFLEGKDTEERIKGVSHKAFDCSGENEASHLFYICFDTILDHTCGMDLVLSVDANKKEEAVKAATLLASGKVEITIAESVSQEEEVYRCIPFDSVSAKDGKVFLKKADYIPTQLCLRGKTGYFLIIRTLDEVVDLVLSGIRLGLERGELIPEIKRLDGADTKAEEFYPFGEPMQLLAECCMDCAEAFSKKGAAITISFELGYTHREEKLELPDINIEYKAIMKRPPEVAYTKPAMVCADRIVWEYLSKTGWKRLLEDEASEKMMNGESEGNVEVTFVCPTDMVTMEEADEPRLRIRLLKADNIYKIPAIYKSPVIRHLRIAYSYEGREQTPLAAYTRNNYQMQDCMERFVTGVNTQIFYATERAERSMYLCFDESIQGMPFSLYFDLDNYSNLPIDFTVEYSRQDDFKPIHIVDGTSGMLNSGSMQFLISSDMAKRTLFGKEGYFLRFTGYEKEYPDYRLPIIKGIYPNVAKVENRSTSEEYFYIDDKNEALSVKLKKENLKQISVWIHEKDGQNDEWVEWKQATHSYEYGRVYHVDMAQGIVNFGSFAFSDISLSDNGPEIMIKHRNYEGAAANLPKNSLQTMRDSNRFVSEVTNLFSTYGGYDAYTEKSTTDYITGVLRSRNRAVTEGDILDLLRQTSYSVVSMKCGLDVDVLGNEAPGKATVAVLTKEYDKGTHIFHEIRGEMKKKLEEEGSFLAMGREVDIVQPHFLRLNLRLWLEKETMENAYNLQNMAYAVIEEFIDPIKGGLNGEGWKIGSFPRVSQIRAYLRKRLKDVSIAKMAVTILTEDKEIEIKEDISAISKSPFILPVSGEHMIHIDLKQ